MIKKIFVLILFLPFIFTHKAFAAKILNLPVEGDFKQTIKYVDVGGNRSLSFKDPGWHSLTELNLNMYKQFQDGWISSAQMQLRKTDDNEIDQYHNGVRLLSWLIETRNETFDIQIGDIYSNFTDFTLSRALEGISSEATFDRVTLNTVLSRAYKSNKDISDPKYMRYVFGQRGSYEVIRDGRWLNNLKMGANIVYTVDDVGTLREPSAMTDDGEVQVEGAATGLRNYVWSLDQEWRFFENLTISSEFARSGARDTNAVTIDGHRVGNAIRARSEYSIAPFRGSFQFHRIDPNFYTDSGSAATDQEMYQYAFSFLPNSRLATDINYSQYHDNLDEVPDRQSTKTNNPSISFRIQPFKERRSFRINPRYDWRKQKNTLSTTNSQTHTANIALADQIKYFSWNFGYNYRKFCDYAGNSDNYVNTGNLGISYNFSFPQLSYTPSLNYSYTRETYSSPFSRTDKTNNISFGMNFRVGDKFNGSFNYGFVNTTRMTEDANTTNHRGGVDLDYRLADWGSLKTYWNINKNWRKGGGFSVREIESGMTFNARF